MNIEEKIIYDKSEQKYQGNITKSERKKDSKGKELPKKQDHHKKFGIISSRILLIYSMLMGEERT